MKKWSVLLFLLLTSPFNSSAIAAMERTRVFSSLQGLIAVHPEIKMTFRTHLNDALSGNLQACLLNLATLATSPDVDPTRASVAQMILGLASQPDLVNQNMWELGQLLGVKEAMAVSKVAQAFQRPIWDSLRKQAKVVDFSRNHSDFKEARSYWSSVFDLARNDRKSAPVFVDEFAESQISRKTASENNKNPRQEDRRQVDSDPPLFANDIIGARSYNPILPSNNRLARLMALGRFGIAKIAKGSRANNAVQGLIEDLNSSNLKLSAFSAKLLPKLGAKAVQPLVWEMKRREITQEHALSQLTPNHGPAEILTILSNMKDLNLIDEFATYLSHQEAEIAMAASNAIETMRSRVPDSDNIIAVKLAASYGQTMTERRKEFEAFYSNWHYRYPASPAKWKRYKELASNWLWVALIAGTFLGCFLVFFPGPRFGLAAAILTILALCIGGKFALSQFYKEGRELALRNMANIQADAAEKQSDTLVHADDILNFEKFKAMNKVSRDWEIFNASGKAAGNRNNILSFLRTLPLYIMIAATAIGIMLIAKVGIPTYLIAVSLSSLSLFIGLKIFNAYRAAKNKAADAFETEWEIAVDAGKLPATFEEMAYLKHRQTPPDYLNQPQD